MIPPGDPAATARAPLHVSPRALQVGVIPPAVARAVVQRAHYLHSFPAGTRVCLGVFAPTGLEGVGVLGVGPRFAHRLVQGATARDGLTLTRLWLADALPPNSESYVIGQMVRWLRQHTPVKFLLSYADPAAGHVGTIYQATNWLYTGLSQAQPALDLGDGVPRHTRSVGSALGTHSVRYLRAAGLAVHRVPAVGKHRYVLFIDRRWRGRLAVPTVPYPKQEDRAHAGD